MKDEGINLGNVIIATWLIMTWAHLHDVELA